MHMQTGHLRQDTGIAPERYIRFRELRSLVPLVAPRFGGWLATVPFPRAGASGNSRAHGSCLR